MFLSGISGLKRMAPANQARSRRRTDGDAHTRAHLSRLGKKLDVSKKYADGPSHRAKSQDGNGKLRKGTFDPDSEIGDV